MAHQMQRYWKGATSSRKLQGLYPVQYLNRSGGCWAITSPPHGALLARPLPAHEAQNPMDGDPQDIVNGHSCYRRHTFPEEGATDQTRACPSKNPLPPSNLHA